MQKTLVDQPFDTGLAPVNTTAIGEPVEILTEYDLTETVKQREEDTLTAFCVSGLGHTFVSLPDFVEGRDTVECTVCGTIVVRPEPKRRED
jgi:hypothetical protein